ERVGWAWGWRCCWGRGRGGRGGGGGDRRRRVGWGGDRRRRVSQRGDRRRRVPRRGDRQRRFPHRGHRRRRVSQRGPWGRLPRSRFPQWIRRRPQLRVPAGVCTTRQSVCVRSFPSIPPPPLLRLCRRAVRRRRWPLWRHVLDVATDTVGLAASLGLRLRLWLLLSGR